MRTKRLAEKTATNSAAGLTLDEIRRLIDLMESAGVAEFELKEAGRRLRIRLKGELVTAPLAVPAPVIAAVPAAGAPAVPAPPPPAGPAPQAGTTVFKSPMVGTFYRSPSPEAELFVKKGDKVGPETTLCIIEAMKVMNEIKAEMDAEVVEVLVQNGEAVEFGQPLFVLKPL